MIFVIAVAMLYLLGPSIALPAPGSSLAKPIMEFLEIPQINEALEETDEEWFEKDNEKWAIINQEIYDELEEALAFMQNHDASYNIEKIQRIRDAFDTNEFERISRMQDLEPLLSDGRSYDWSSEADLKQAIKHIYGERIASEAIRILDENDFSWDIFVKNPGKRFWEVKPESLRELLIVLEVSVALYT